jgi:hypothetical protein
MANWYALRTASATLHLPAGWTVHVTTAMLEALGIDASEDVYIYGENAHGQMGPGAFTAKDPCHYRVASPMAFDGEFRLYHITGCTLSGVRPSAGLAAIEGAFLRTTVPTPVSSTGEEEEDEEAVSIERTGGHFTNTRHGHVFAFLAHGVSPTLRVKRMKDMSAADHRKQKARVSQFRKNAKARYALDADGHLIYLVGKRNRKDTVRNIRLSMHPTRIIPFDDEIDAVRPLH